MVKYTVKTYSGGRANSSKVAASRKLVTKAAQLLRSRNATAPRAPLRTGGYYGSYLRRGRDELKYIDTTSTGTVNGTGSLTLLNGIAQGQDITQRIGRKAILKSIYFRLDLYPSTTASSPTGDIVRVLVVYDCQTNSSAPGLGNILISPQYLSPMNLDYRDRFKILIDKHVTMPANVYTTGNISAGEGQPKIVKVFKRLNMDQVFSGTANTIGSIATGSIYLVLLALGTNVTTANMWCRIRFTDS